jgi:hypothetical protein
MTTLAEYTDSERRTLWTDAYLKTATHLTKGLAIVLLITYSPLLFPFFWNAVHNRTVAILMTLLGFGFVVTICSLIVNHKFKVPDPVRSANHLWAYFGIGAFGVSLFFNWWAVVHSLHIFFIFVMMLNIHALLKALDPDSQIFALAISLIGAFTVGIPYTAVLGVSPFHEARSLLYLSALTLYIFDSIDAVLVDDRILDPRTPVIASIYPIIRPMVWLKSAKSARKSNKQKMRD